jgi:hypothetical protein
LVAVHVPLSAPHAPLAVYVPLIVLPEMVPVNDTVTPAYVAVSVTVLTLTLPDTFELASEDTQEFTTTNAVEVTEPPVSARFASTITAATPRLLVEVAVVCHGPETSAFCGGGLLPPLLLEPPLQPLNAHTSTHKIAGFFNANLLCLCDELPMNLLFPKTSSVSIGLIT